VLLRAGNKREAIEQAKLAFDIEPHTAEELVRLEEVFRAAGAGADGVRAAEARAVLLAAQVARRGDPGVARWSRARGSRRRQAAAALEKVPDLDPRELTATTRRGVAPGGRTGAFTRVCDQPRSTSSTGREDLPARSPPSTRSGWPEGVPLPVPSARDAPGDADGSRRRAPRGGDGGPRGACRGARAGLEEARGLARAASRVARQGARRAAYDRRAHAAFRRAPRPTRRARRRRRRLHRVSRGAAGPRPESSRSSRSSRRLRLDENRRRSSRSRRL
jgi:hypothetical protein